MNREAEPYTNGIDMIELRRGKLTSRDETIARILKLAPWLSLFLITLPAPLVFFLLFLLTTTTESAALYLFLSLFSGGLGLVASLLVMIFLSIYRKRWLGRLRDRLAENGITAGEVEWFLPELTTAERASLREITKQDPLLGDAYRETLAARLMATRIKQRANRELVRVRRRLNQAQRLKGTDTTSLVTALQSDRHRLEQVSNEVEARLIKAKAQLQTIEASASRETNKTEMDLMMGQLSFTQEYLPLLMEMSQLESGALEGESSQNADKSPSE